MLQRTRNRAERPQSSDWPGVADDYMSRVDPVDGSDFDFRDVQPRRKKRSVAGRVFVRLLLAVVVLAMGAGAYYFAADGALEDFLARSDAFLSRSADSKEQPAFAADAPAAAAGQQAAPNQQQQALPQIPDANGLTILIRAAIVSLDQANISGNYSVLHDLAAPSLQQANTPARLSEAFTDLRSRELDLSQVVVAGPSLRAAPAIDSKGLLHMAGSFPAGAEQVDFEAAYQLVNGRWRVFALGVFPSEQGQPKPDVKVTDSAAAASIPDNAALVKLIRTTVIALNQANQTGNYSVLRDFAAPGFREANDLSTLAQIFGDLRGRQLDLGPVAVIEPRLFKPPEIDARGYLRLTGFFPSQPEQVNFDLAFQFAGGKWKLFGIGINTSREVPVSQAQPPAGSPRGQPQGQTAPAPAPGGDGGAPAAGNPDQPAAAAAPVVPPVPHLRPGT